MPTSQNYGISSPDYGNATLGDQWMSGLNAQADRMNAAAPRGGGGGGGGSANSTLPGGWIQKSSEYMYDNPELQFQQGQAAIKNQHWNDIFGAIAGRLGNLANPYTIGGGTIGKQPAIDAKPIWNPQQIQQNVNLQNAKSDASTQTQIRDQGASAAGRGFGSTSPLLAALNTSAQNANQAGKSANETNFRTQAAQANAGQVLKGQTAQESQFASRQNEAIERAKPYFAQQNALIAALGSLS